MTWPLDHDTALALLIVLYVAIGVLLTLGVAAPIARWLEGRDEQRHRVRPR